MGAPRPSQGVEPLEATRGSSKVTPCAQIKLPPARLKLNGVWSDLELYARKSPKGNLVLSSRDWIMVFRDPNQLISQLVLVI